MTCTHRNSFLYKILILMCSFNCKWDALTYIFSVHGIEMESWLDVDCQHIGSRLVRFSTAFRFSTLLIISLQLSLYHHRCIRKQWRIVMHGFIWRMWFNKAVVACKLCSSANLGTILIQRYQLWENYDTPIATSTRWSSKSPNLRCSFCSWTRAVASVGDVGGNNW